MSLRFLSDQCVPAEITDTFRFCDPLNKERRFLPLRLDDAPSRYADTLFEACPDGPFARILSCLIANTAF